MHKVYKSLINVGLIYFNLASNHAKCPVDINGYFTLTLKYLFHNKIKN